jgi:sigma-B regulation protein RsbU (phosphoserine phosphatase)
MALFRSLIRAFAQQHHTMSWADVLDSTLSDKPRRGAKMQRQALTMIGANALKNAVMMTNAYMVDNHRKARMYATLFFGVLDPASGTLIYVNGGHNPPLLIGQNGIKSELEPTGPVVGIFPEADFDIHQVQFDPGDVLFCYTDGIPEAKSPDNSFFSEARMLDLITQPAETATALVGRVEEQVSAHMADGPQFDDITMLAVQRQHEDAADEESSERSTRESASAPADIKRDPLAYL